MFLFGLVGFFLVCFMGRMFFVFLGVLGVALILTSGMHPLLTTHCVSLFALF